MSNESTKPDVVTNEQQCAAMHLPLWAVLDVWKLKFRLGQHTGRL